MRRVLFTSAAGIIALALFVSCASMPCQKTAATPAADVTILSNRDYFPVVHRLFQEAERSIRVMMFSARYYTEKPRFAGDIEHEPGTHWSDTNVLLDDLVEAAERGVDVKLILDSSSWNESNTELNEIFGRILVERGVPVYMDDPEVTTHTKLILVDDDLVVVGSTNWSYYALDTNNETSVFLRSPEISRDYHEFFSEVLDNSSLLTLSETSSEQE
jgi:phosphatidylserine/phosphatidylglycerophosphate/cardiolipin synthase-like enzyme